MACCVPYLYLSMAFSNGGAVANGATKQHTSEELNQLRRDTQSSISPLLVSLDSLDEVSSCLPWLLRVLTVRTKDRGEFILFLSRRLKDLLRSVVPLQWERGIEFNQATRANGAFLTNAFGSGGAPQNGAGVGNASVGGGWMNSFKPY